MTALYRSVRAAAVDLKRSLLRTDAKIVATYFATHKLRRLHVGCGTHLIAGFLNADLSSTSDHVLRLDATKPFPFDDGSFDYIFSEHMIEHIHYLDGLNMLSECYRVLKKGGKIRISTPDLERVMALGRHDRTELQNAYIAWSVDQFASFAPDGDPTFVINNFFRDWGHQFIYARKTLAASLNQCGFADITPCRITESSTPELRHLENEGRMPSGFLALETMTLEATKQD
ncbi:MAG TPA: methyltransferase domain-containing protein [Frateuria sp.]|uniref:class I SAM-dependent methyltransferase n=1 Tax=Frateuria sp. TaxID=2211372 RepID=UPI002DE76B48|nr:methyltransferase domain-containing protein [Frateuria sp.]